MERGVTAVSMVLVILGMVGVAAARAPSRDAAGTLRGGGRSGLMLFCTVGQLGSALAAAVLGLAAGAGLEIAARQVVSAGAALMVLGASLAVLDRAEPTSDSRRIGLPTLALAAGVYSLAGLPPTDGFFAKMLIYESGIRSGDLVSRLTVGLVALFNLIWLVRGSELVSSARRMEKAQGPPIARKGEALVMALLICFIVGGGLLPGFFSQVWRFIVAQR